MPEIIIFDMDGVLVDSEPLHKELEQQLFKELDLQITPAYYNQLVGTSPRQMWERITSDFELQIPVDELLQREKELKLSEIRKLRLQLNKGVEALLKDLKKNEFRLSVGSSSPKKIIELFLEKTGIAHLFDHAVSSEEVTHGKPAPDIFRKDCFFIRDSSGRLGGGGRQPERSSCCKGRRNEVYWLCECKFWRAGSVAGRPAGGAF